MIQVDYGICSAVTDELEFIKNACSDLKQITLGDVEYTLGTIHNKSVAMVATGMGTSCAAAVTTCLAKDFDVQGLFYLGTAGGLSAGLKRGDVVIGTSAYELEIQGMIDSMKNTPFEPGLLHAFKNETQRIHFDADPTLLQFAQEIQLDNQNKVVQGTLVSANNFQPSRHQMDQIFASDALAIDMESSAVYQVGWLFSLPTLVIRGISNELKSCGDPHNCVVEMGIGEKNSARVLSALLERMAQSD